MRSAPRKSELSQAMAMRGYPLSVENPVGPSKNVARVLRRRMTQTERFVWQQLRNRSTHYYFRRQHRIAGYVLDFYCHRSRLCIELDGLSHDTYHATRDRLRDSTLEEMGILTLRFRNEEIATDWSACLTKILFACIERDAKNFSGDEG